jgi:hypothetical protein
VGLPVLKPGQSQKMGLSSAETWKVLGKQEQVGHPKYNSISLFLVAPPT